MTLRGSTCTASIIGDNWLLTAGHCIEDLFITGNKYDITRKTKYGDLKVYMTDAPYDEESFAVSRAFLKNMTFLSMLIVISVNKMNTLNISYNLFT